MFLFYSIHWKDLVDFLNGCKGNHLYCSSAKKWELLVDTNKLNDKEHQPLEAMKGWSMVLFPTGVAGRDRDACTAESVLSMSRVGELGADILTSEVLSRTANSCRKSTWKCTFCTDKPEQTEMECFVQFFNLTVSANILITTEKHVCLISLHYKNLSVEISVSISAQNTLTSIVCLHGTLLQYNPFPIDKIKSCPTCFFLIW